jgi:transposase InsO family protein
MDLFVVPTIGFNSLFVLVIVRLARRELVWINVTAHPTAKWIAQQITEAFPWKEAPRYLIRDQDGIYGVAVTRRLRAMGIRDKPIAPGSPWHNAFAERLIGSIRRECVDGGLGRGPLAPSAKILRPILQRVANSSRAEQRCPVSSRG